MKMYMKSVVIKKKTRKENKGMLYLCIRNCIMHYLCVMTGDCIVKSDGRQLREFETRGIIFSLTIKHCGRLAIFRQDYLVVPSEKTAQE